MSRGVVIDYFAESLYNRVILIKVILAIGLTQQKYSHWYKRAAFIPRNTTDSLADMASGKTKAEASWRTDLDEEYEDEQYINQEDIVEEIQIDGDAPMDEEDNDDESRDTVGHLGEAPFNDNSVQHFPSHSASVFAVSCHPTQPLAVSGGEDDLSYIWDITDGEVVVKLTGHTDSVTCTAWSADGELVSTGGMDGKVRIWRRVGKENYQTWEFLTELQGPDEVMVCTFFRSEEAKLSIVFLVLKMAPKRKRFVSWFK